MNINLTLFKNQKCIIVFPFEIDTHLMLILTKEEVLYETNYSGTRRTA